MCGQPLSWRSSPSSSKQRYVEMGDGAGLSVLFYLLFVLQVACRPFSSAAMQAFVHVLLLPLPTLRSYVQLMQMHMVPHPGAVWRIALCLTVPQGTDLPDVGNISLSPGSAGVFYWGRLVLVVSHMPAHT